MFSTIPRITKKLVHHYIKLESSSCQIYLRFRGIYALTPADKSVSKMFQSVFLFLLLTIENSSATWFRIGSVHLHHLLCSISMLAWLREIPTPHFLFDQKLNITHTSTNLSYITTQKATSHLPNPTSLQERCPPITSTSTVDVNLFSSPFLYRCKLQQ